MREDSSSCHSSHFDGPRAHEQSDNSRYEPHKIGRGLRVLQLLDAVSILQLSPMGLNRSPGSKRAGGPVLNPNADVGT